MDTIIHRERLFKHSMTMLEEAVSWDWGKKGISRTQLSKEQSGKTFEKVLVPFLRCLIEESYWLGGTVTETFWRTLGECDKRLNNNLDILRQTPFQDKNHSVQIMSKGIEGGLETIDYTRVIAMAADYLTHLGVAICNPGGHRPKKSSSNSVTEVVTDELLAVLDSQDPSWKSRKQKALKELAFRRDGDHCPVTSAPCSPKIPGGALPILSHVIPNAIQDNKEVLNHIAMFAGERTRDMVAENLNRIGNVMNLQADAHGHYDQLEWAIEAREAPGMATQYLFRRIPSSAPKIYNVPFQDGEEISFGQGTPGDREKLGSGPLPALCNLKLAVTRLMKMSGAADVLTRYQEDAEDSEFTHVYIASEDWLDVVDAKLVLSGRAPLV